MAIQKTDAIVIRTQLFRSTSLIVTFFTRDHGKIKGIVKGVRQEREMRGSLFELFTKLEIIYYEKIRSDLHLVSEAFILESHETLRSRLEGIAYASYFVELIDQLTEVHDPHPELFDLLEFCLRYLSALPQERLSRMFEMKLLAEIGWLPHLDACVRCGERPLAPAYFSPVQGAVFCKRCASAVGDSKPLSQETLQAMHYYMDHDLDQSLKYPLSQTTEQGLTQLLSRFFQARLQRPLKSLVFIDKVKATLSS